MHYSTHTICKNNNEATTSSIKYFSSFLLLSLLTIIIQASHGGFTIAAASSSSSSSKQMGLRNSEDHSPTHMSFFRAALRGRQRVLSCANNPSVCLDREKNPWGGDTCCFRKFCKDLSRDLNNCGGCGNVCGFGFVCCDGKCVDVQNDPQHCGSCFEECLGENRCVYAMCDYGG